MATITVFKARLAVLLFLASLFLAMASVSVGHASGEKEDRRFQVCVRKCALEKDPYRQIACRARCRKISEEEPQRAKQPGEEEQQDPQEQRPQRPGREQEQEKERPGQEQEGRQQEEWRQREKERWQREEERRRQQQREQQQQQQRPGREEGRGQQEEGQRQQEKEQEQERRPREREERQQEEGQRQQEKEQEQERRPREREERQQEEGQRQQEKEQEQERRPREQEKRQPEEGQRQQEKEQEQERRPREQKERQQEEGQRQQEKEQEQERRPREQEERQQEEGQRQQEKEQEQGRRPREQEERQPEEGQGSQNQNPYLFRSRNFQTRIQNERGRIRILQRFEQRSPLLQWLQYYRYVEFELQPESLFLPHHRDAHALFVVLEGSAIVSIANKNNKESFNLKQGDLLRIPAGSLVYTANVDENESFRAANLLFPINIPGQYENFYPSGNQKLKSYYNAFSKKTLEASFNANYEEIRRILLRQQEQQEQGQELEQSSEEGVFVKLSKEHIRELRRQAKHSPKGGRSSSSGPLNLRNLKPLYSNDYGNFWEARPQDYKPLRDIDVSVSFLDLQKGSLFLPHFNSKAITIAQVVDGQAKLEIASPHLANQRSESEQGQAQEEQDEQEQREGQIQSVSSNLRQGDIFVILAGHPIALRASKNSNLTVVGFALNAENNQRNFLAGEKDNVLNQIEKVIKEVAFPGSGKNVDRLLRNQKESYFVNPQRQQREEERQEERPPLSSIVDAFF